MKKTRPKKLRKNKMDKIASAVCKAEKGKTQVKIGDMRQILRILYEMELLVA